MQARQGARVLSRSRAGGRRSAGQGAECGRAGGRRRRQPTRTMFSSFCLMTGITAPARPGEPMRPWVMPPPGAPPPCARPPCRTSPQRTTHARGPYQTRQHRCGSHPAHLSRNPCTSRAHVRRELLCLPHPSQTGKVASRVDSAGSTPPCGLKRRRSCA